MAAVAGHVPGLTAMPGLDASNARAQGGVARLRSLDMLRAVAATLVVLFHTETLFAPLAPAVPFAGAFAAGHRGVDLFFVLSGFIIAFVHADDFGRPDRLRGYVFNRAARIYPSVWIMTAFALGIYSLGFGGAGVAGRLSPGSVAASTLLLPQLNDAVVNVTWTLKYEMFFYAVFAIAILNRRAGFTALAAWQLATLAVTVAGVDFGLPGFYLRPACLEFSAGLGCAWWARRHAGPTGAAGCLALLCAGAALFVAGMALDRTAPWAGVPCATGAGVIILALVRLEGAGALPAARPLVLLGKASYAVYLVHRSVITLAVAVLGRLHVPATDALCLAAAAAATLAGLAFDRIADRPVQQWLRRKGRMAGPAARR